MTVCPDLVSTYLGVVESVAAVAKLAAVANLAAVAKVAALTKAKDMAAPDALESRACPGFFLAVSKTPRHQLTRGKLMQQNFRQQPLTKFHLFMAQDVGTFDQVSPLYGKRWGTFHQVSPLYGKRWVETFDQVLPVYGKTWRKPLTKFHLFMAKDGGTFDQVSPLYGKTCGKLRFPHL